MSAIKSGKMPDIPNMTSGQKKALEEIVPYFTKDRPVGPGGVETVEGGQPNLDFDARKNLNDYLEREIGNANQLASAEKQQIKLQIFTEAIQSKEPIKRNKYTEEFEIFWSYYPRKSGSKRRASELYNQIVNKNQEIDAQSLLQVVRVFAEANEKSDQKFIPHASTWLHQRRFETNVHFVDEKRRRTNQKIQANKNQLAG